MKTRTIPFGYIIQNGIVTVHQAEAETVQYIINAYLDGLSLKKIADELNKRQIEYMPGVIGWNPARLKHIIEDRRYLGNELYPAISDAVTYGKLQSIKSERNTQKQTDRSADIYRLDVPVLCPICGGEMHRRSDSQKKCKSWWTCCRTEERHTVNIPDETLLDNLTDIMNRLIQNPAIVQSPADNCTEPCVAVRRLENEINHLLDGYSINKDDLHRKMLELVTIKYDDIDTAEPTTEYLKAGFDKSSPLSSFSLTLFKQTVREIRFHKGNSISVILKNGQEIGKENEHNGCRAYTEKGSALYTA